MYAAGFQCAGCGEWIETTVDESAGSKQQYVEDCQVCCQPMQVLVTVEDEDDCSVSVSRLDE